MNATQEVREQYKMAAREHLRHVAGSDRYKSLEYYEGLMNGIKRALSCLGVTSDEIREMYADCEEQAKDERANEDIDPSDASYDEEGFVKERSVSPKEWIAYCDKCGKPFNPKDAVKVPYQEYPGASASYEEASPCCGTGFSDRPKEDVEQEELDAIELPVSQARVEAEQ